MNKLAQQYLDEVANEAFLDEMVKIAIIGKALGTATKGLAKGPSRMANPARMKAMASGQQAAGLAQRAKPTPSFLSRGAQPGIRAQVARATRAAKSSKMDALQHTRQRFPMPLGPRPVR